MPIRFFDMFAGIGGFRSGLEAIGGFQCVGYCEIDKYAKQAYEAIYDTGGEMYFADARKIKAEDLSEIDLICGGFPCQSFSIAGERGGFDDPRGTLFFEIARLAEAKRPKYLLLENVPGLLNHNGGRTFATIPNYSFSYSEEGNTGVRQNYYDRIKAVKLPKTVKRIGYNAFDHCKNLKSINIPKGIKSLGESAFNNCVNLNKITIPGTLKSIQFHTFAECEKLKSVKIGSGVKNINYMAFYNCKALKNIKIPNSVVKIGKYSFSECKKLKKIIIPNKTKDIGDYAFEGCKKLKSVKIGNNVKTIGKYAFVNCKALKSVRIPKTVKTIKKYAFGFKEELLEPEGYYVEKPIENITIKGCKGTVAEKYAKKTALNS